MYIHRENEKCGMYKHRENEKSSEEDGGKRCLQSALIALLTIDFRPSLPPASVAVGYGTASRTESSFCPFPVSAR